jgi:sugar lactone lactonase YvrE
MKNPLFAASLCALGVSLLYLCLWPTPGEPLAWAAPHPPSLETGPFAGNERLKGIQRIATGIGYGPESIAIEPSTGNLLTGVADGSVVRLNRDGRRSEIFGKTGGRPLGLAICPDGSVLVADALKGLLRIRSKDAPAEVLATEAQGVPFGFVDNVTVDEMGRYVYFTDASSKWGYGRDREDIVEHGGHGRLLRYDLDTGSITLIKDGLNFANGVILGPGEKYLLIDESGSYRTLRVWLTEGRLGQTEVFVDNLPGYPDNISYNGKDLVWIALPAPRSRLIDYLSGSPFARKIILRLLAIVDLPIQRRAMAMAFDLNGHLVANLQYQGAGVYDYITQVTEVNGDLYFGSLRQYSIAYLPNWQHTK